METLLKTALLLLMLSGGDGRDWRAPGSEAADAAALCRLRGEGAVAPHERFCDRYLTCHRGVVYEANCANGMVFWPARAVLQHCAYPAEAPYACIDKALANEPVSTEHCPWLYGIFSHETSCTRYWTCWNGTATKQFCVGGLLYNEKTHGCDWPQNVADCQKHPLCAEDSNANVPLGNSCERYWSCQGGYPRLMRCPATMVFDKVTSICVQPPTADCDVPPPEVLVEGELVEEEEEVRERDVDALVVIPKQLQTSAGAQQRFQPQQQQPQPQTQRKRFVSQPRALLVKVGADEATQDVEARAGLPQRQVRYLRRGAQRSAAAADFTSAAVSSQQGFSRAQAPASGPVVPPGAILVE